MITWQSMRGLERFFDVSTQRIRTSAGEAELPIKYRDGRAITLVYRTRATAVTPLLADRGLRPVRIRHDTSLAAITWFEYRDTSIGPYNELSIAVAATPCQAARTSSRGMFVVHLPVTTELACSAGCELYGFPKIVADISLRGTDGAVDAALMVGGSQVLGMHVPLRFGFVPVALPTPNLPTYSVLNDRLIATHIKTKCRTRISRGRGSRLEIHGSEHPIARTLQALELPSEPLGLLYQNPFRALLPLGTTIAKLPRGEARPDGPSAYQVRG